jgi:hypothetical protein
MLLFMVLGLTGLVENFRCLDIEWEIPIQAAPNGDRDYEMIQRAWYVFILL